MHAAGALPCSFHATALLWPCLSFSSCKSGEFEFLSEFTRVVRDMSSALTPAQKAAITKQVKKTAAKQGEQIVEGGAALLSLAHKSCADAIAEMLKQKEYGFCLLLKELIANGALEQVLMVNEEGDAGEKVLYIRQGCVRWRALP
eukprot:5809258-Amphidinium_carterae.1